uniref:Uncharacterized protein n=1 Tax=Arundo donax TaxID=35708 RepID=A0A0A9AFK5_ARUDO
MKIYDISKVAPIKCLVFDCTSQNEVVHFNNLSCPSIETSQLLPVQLHSPTLNSLSNKNTPPIIVI